MVNAITASIGAEQVHCVDADALATRLLGDAIDANLLLVGHAYQRGLIPMSADAIERAIAVNGVAVEFNQRAFRLGRLRAYDPARIARALGGSAEADRQPPSLEQVLDRRTALLTNYQDAAYADRYRCLVERVRSIESVRVLGASGLTLAVSHTYFQLLAFKDEYEVARLYQSGRLSDAAAPAVHRRRAAAH